MLNEFINSYDFIRILESFSDLFIIILFFIIIHLSANLVIKVHRYITNHENGNSRGDNNE